MNPEIDRLNAELDRIREAAALDLTNLQNDLIAKNREIGRLKAQLEKTQEEEPDNDQVRRLLLHWKQTMRKNPRTDIGTAGKRYRIGKMALNRWGYERCEHAITGLSLNQHVGPRGRAAEAYPGSSVKHDLEHAFGTDANPDETRLERCLEYYEEHVHPVLAPVVDLPTTKPEPEPVPAVRKVPPVPPINKVLNAFAPDNWPVPAVNDPDRWSALCPAHDDHHPSLSITRSGTGHVLVKCWAGCETEAVLDALRLTWSDLFADSWWDAGCVDSVYRGDPRRGRVLPAEDVALLRECQSVIARSERRAA